MCWTRSNEKKEQKKISILNTVPKFISDKDDGFGRVIEHGFHLIPVGNGFIYISTSLSGKG